MIKDELSLDYALCWVAYFQERLDIRVSLAVSSPMRTASLFSTARRRGFAGREVPFVIGLFSRWRLVCFPSHGGAAFFHPNQRKIYVPHGIGGGRIIFGGSNYTFGWKAMASKKRCAYDAFLTVDSVEQSLVYSDRFAEQISGKLFLATEPAALRMLTYANKHKSHTRGVFDPVSDARRSKLLIMSTWGDLSNLACFGETLAEQIQVLRVKYDVLLSLHPKSYTSQRTRDIIEEFKRNGCTIVAPAINDWIPALHTADLAIGDMTSLAVYYALLLKPLVFFECETINRQHPTCPIRNLYAICPRVNIVDPLMSQLEGLNTVATTKMLKTYRDQFFPHITDESRLRSFLIST